MDQVVLKRASLLAELVLISLVIYGAGWQVLKLGCIFVLVSLIVKVCVYICWLRKELSKPNQSSPTHTGPSLSGSAYLFWDFWGRRRRIGLLVPEWDRCKLLKVADLNPFPKRCTVDSPTQVCDPGGNRTHNLLFLSLASYHWAVATGSCLSVHLLLVLLLK